VLDTGSGGGSTQAILARPVLVDEALELIEVYAVVRLQAPHLKYVSVRQHTSAYVSTRQHTSAYVSIRQHKM
jgi:hypothetical protein